MKHLTIPAFALATFATAASAASSTPALALADYSIPGNAVTTSAPAKVAGTTTGFGTPMANTYRSYPPSCAHYPLPDKPSGTTWTASVPTIASTNTGSTLENLTVTVWRMPCSSSGSATPYSVAGVKNAVTLVRVDRADDSVTTAVPLRPRLLISQGAVTYGVIRVAPEPNTILSEAQYGALMPKSSTFILENFSDSTSPRFNFNNAFTLNVLGGTGASKDIAVPAYAPTADAYPDAFNPLPIDGYVAAQWYNSARNEGVIVQVAEAYDNANPQRRMFVFDLLTKDADNDPFWLVGTASFDPTAGGVRSLDVPVSYLTDNNATLAWGTAHVTFTDCNHMNMTFAPATGLPADVPLISDTISYERLLSANGMLCE